MDYDGKVLFEAIIDAVSGEGSIQSRMLSLIDHCETQVAHPQWSEFRQLDYELDKDRLQDWLTQTISAEGIEFAPKALWFGLFNAFDGETETADIYVGCCSRFADDALEWASTLQAPQELDSTVLRNHYVAAYRDDDCLENLAEYPLALAYGGIIAQEAIEISRPELRQPTLQGAAVGFDSGDVMMLGRFSENGFCPDVMEL
jgi:hypothetical protein